MSLHTNLNQEQLQVVQNIGGVIRVISGPGTGKSTTCVHYIAEIIASQKAQPEEILGVTFTKKAANELKQRVKKMVNKNPNVSTIHSFCAGVLKKYPPPGFSKNFTILDEPGQFIVINNLVRQLGEDLHPWAILEILTLARNSRDKDLLEREGLTGFYKTYMNYLQKQDTIDYDGLLTWCLNIFKKNPQILEYYQNKYSYVLVDEFQDVSPIQLEIIKLLVEAKNNLLVVGDPDQSIYKFRGADVSIITELERVFPRLKTFYLSQNYRSTQAIVKGASNLIAYNKFRLDKPLFTSNSPGMAPVIKGFSTETQEVEYIADTIQETVAAGSRYEDFAILYRVNFLGNEVETLFSGRGIPYQILGGTGYYQRTEIMNMLAFFQLAQEPTNNSAFLRACTVLAQTHGSSIKNFKNQQTSKQVPLIDGAYLARESFIRELPDLINQLAALEDLPTIYELILSQTNYLEHLRKDTSKEGERRVENLEELKSVLVKFQENGQGLGDFLDQISKVHEEREHNSVKLMTIHAAKGLEFPRVFIIRAGQGMYPFFKAQTEEELEEERRLFYVAITRAKNQINITYPEERLIKGEKIKTKPSDYIKELQNTHNGKGFNGKVVSPLDSTYKKIGHGLVSKDDISTGSVVYHGFFGKGYVLEIEEGKETLVKINFAGEEKTLILEFAPLEVL